MPVTINLDGPDGNAFALLGYARRFGRQLGWDEAKIEEVVTDMMSSDYNNLLAQFLNYFDGLVVFEGFAWDGDDEDDDDDEEDE